MQGIKILLRQRQVFAFFPKSRFHTCSILYIRRKKLFGEKHENDSDRLPTFKKNLDDENFEDLKHFHEEGEFEELNLMRTDQAYDEHERQQKAWKQKVRHMITAQKFFSPGRQPQMLTYNEKLCIKYLHKKDPIQWNIRTLSESFPATPEIISKVLRSNWEPTKEKIAKMDKTVQNNWKLLEEGTLDVNSEYREHLKSFVNRREILLEQIKNAKFYLPEVKPKEKIWNKNEMTSIALSYERILAKLEAENTKALSDGLNSDENKLNPNQENSKKDPLEKLHLKVSKVAETRSLEGEESFEMGKIGRNGESLTYEQLLDRITIKEEKNKEQLTLTEQAILEYEKSKRKSSNISDKGQNNFINANPICDGAEEKIGLDSLNDSFFSKKINIRNNGKFNRRLEKFEKSQCREIKNPDFKSHETGDIVRRTGESTKLVSELEVGKILNKNTENSNGPAVKRHVQRFIELYESDPERMEKDRNYYEKEVDSIRHTAFWNSGEKSELRALREEEKKSLKETAETGDEEAHVYGEEVGKSYPRRIRIPENQRGSGLTFKVNDCYYDDDGEFLYRVPGMRT